MKNISLYADNGSFLTKIDPMAKVLYVIAAIAIPPIVGKEWMYGCWIALSILLLLAARMLRKAVPVIGVSAIVLLTIFLIQGMFKATNETVVFSIGPAVFYQEGMLYALHIILNVLNILFAICVMIFSTKPSALIEAFVDKGLSPKIGYVIVSIFQLIPQMANTMGTITDAQRSRGMEVDGSIWVRLKALLPLLSPVVMSSLYDTKERAVALEVRGFTSNQKKVFLNENIVKTSDRVIELVLIACIIIAIGWRIFAWLA